LPFDLVVAKPPHGLGIVMAAGAPSFSPSNRINTRRPDELLSDGSSASASRVPSFFVSPRVADFRFEIRKLGGVAKVELVPQDGCTGIAVVIGNSVIHPRLRFAIGLDAFRRSSGVRALLCAIAAPPFILGE